MNLTTRICRLHPLHEFRTSRASGREVSNVFLRLESNGVCGFGEASPISHYSESAEAVVHALQQAAGWIQGISIADASDIGRIWEESWRHLAPSRAAQCALDLALWDLLGRRTSASVCRLALGREPAPVRSFCTIGISTPEELASKTEALRSNPLVKIKSDSAADLLVVRYVREHSSGALAIDANCAWSGHDLHKLCAELKPLGVLFVEQPFPASHDALLETYQLPIFADESCVTEEDLERMPAHFAGFNIKLVKCGGLTPALRMLRVGRKAGLRVMVGCMLESSLLIAAGAVAAQEADYADLDGAWLLTDDPCPAGRFVAGTLHPALGAGFGVNAEALFD